MKSHAPRPSNPATSFRLSACALAVLGLSLVAGCTGSSSRGGPAGSSGPTAQVDATPVNTGTVAPPKHVIVYQDVTATQAKKLEVIVARAPGVQSVGYVPASGDLSVYLKKTFTKKQRKTVKAIVGQTLPGEQPPSRHRKHHHEHH